MNQKGDNCKMSETFIKMLTIWKRQKYEQKRQQTDAENIRIWTKMLTVLKCHKY
mgnify:CR=1 FL=1